MILNPADPPVMMRNTVYCLVDGDSDHDAIESSVEAMVQRVGEYVPGYRLKQRVRFERFTAERPRTIPKAGNSAALASLCCSRWRAPLTICLPTRAISTS